jgi:hypothetical protein
MYKTHGEKRQHFDPERCHNSVTKPETHRKKLILSLSLLWMEQLSHMDKNAMKFG